MSKKSGIEVRNGVADNGDIMRTDLFVKGGKYYAIPLYVADSVKRELPTRVITIGQSYKDWNCLDENYQFLFSLYPNDWVKVIRKGKPILEGYYSSVNRSTASLDIWVHDRNSSVGRKGKIEGIGIKGCLSIERYHVDWLGNLHLAPKMQRQPLSRG